MSPEIRKYKPYTYKQMFNSYELKTLEKYTNQDSLTGIDGPLKSILIIMLIENQEERCFGFTRKR